MKKIGLNEPVETPDGQIWAFDGKIFRLAAAKDEPADSKTPTVESVMHWLRTETRANTGLAFLPDVMRHFSPSRLPQAKEMLVRAASAGLVELRPEGGLDRLSPAERAACLAGPRLGAHQTLLSYARLL